MRFEFECYDVGQLHNLAHCVEEGLVKGPLFIQCALGVLGGLGPEPESLLLMRSTADRLFGRRNYEFSVLGAGRHQMSLVAMGAIMGGHVRVGLEDSLFLSRGLLATSCAAQVLKIRQDPRGAVARHRQPRRGAGDSSDQGSRQGELPWLRRPRARLSNSARRPRGSLLEPIVLAVTLALIVLFSLTIHGFATLGNLSVILSNSTSLVILSCGMAVVIISRGLDLSQVAAMVAGATTFCTLGQRRPLRDRSAIILAVLAMALVGFVNGWLIAFVEIPAMLATLASAMFITGLFRFARPARRVSADSAEIESRRSSSSSPSILPGLTAPVALMIATLIVTWLLLRFTTIGRIVYAHGRQFPGGPPRRPARARNDDCLVYIYSALTALSPAS